MKTIIHKQNDTYRCIQDFDIDNFTGQFFKDKPEVRDVIMSHYKRETNGLTVFRVNEIVENRDASVQSGCSHNGSMAHFVMKLEDVTSHPDFDEFDNSIGLIL